MPDAVQVLYDSRAYPAMSHPLSDPAVSGVGALLGGLRTKLPSAARILEIGCGSGLNLIPLAIRWPGSEFLGIDLSAASIRTARELAAAAGVYNLRFEVADLRDFDPGAGLFDWIIAHGFLSWVPDDVKSTLFSFCRRHLALEGIATVSYNVAVGWKPRLPVIEKTRAILDAGAADLMSALAILRSVTPEGSPDVPIIDDMMAKGPDILSFDDFGPVNDPWSLERFVQNASAAGLLWLGETDPSTNFPAGLDAAKRMDLQAAAADPLAFHSALDASAARTFRSGILCRQDAPVQPRIDMQQMFELCVSIQTKVSIERMTHLFQAIDSFAPRCVSMFDIQSILKNIPENRIASELFRAIQDGWVHVRLEPVVFDPVVPRRPDLGAFRLECARRGFPLVDLWHKPCGFPEKLHPLLLAMDGSRTTDQLRMEAQRHCPDLQWDPWMAHLACRGMFTS